MFRIRGARRAVLVLALAALITPLTAAGGTGAAGAEADRCAAPPGRTGDDLAVTSLAADRRIGVETARARMRAQYRSDELAGRVQRMLGERYGGLWIDTADDDRLTVGVVQRPGMADVTAKVRELAAVCGTGDVTDVVPVSFPMIALVSGIGWLGTEVARANQGAPAALGAAVIPSRNAVVLRLPGDGVLTGAQQTLVQRARERLGAMLQLETSSGNAGPATCDVQSDVCDPPLRAGVVSYLYQQKWCTLAFLARSRSDQKLYIMTAGHCVRDAFAGIDYRTVTWQTRQPRDNNNFHDIGKPHSSYFDSRGDAALITVNNPLGWAARAWVWVRDGLDTQPNEAYRIAADGTQEQAREGRRICHTGATTGSDCGTVTGIYVAVRYVDEHDRPYPFTLTSMLQSSECTLPGDSGGPHYAFNTAYGITSGGNKTGPCVAYIQSITQAENVLNVNVSHENVP